MSPDKQETRQGNCVPIDDCCDVPWRVGRKVGRTIYAQIGDVPSDHDSLIGVMDAPSLAWNAVRAHNAVLAERQR